MPTQDNYWVNWNKFSRIIKGKRVVFFGVAESWFMKTLEKVDIKPEYIVDNSPMRIDTEAFVNNELTAVPVRSPEILRKKEPDQYVVITSGAYHSIVPQLIEYGYKPLEDFCCTPALNNLKTITDIHSQDSTLLICSPDHQIYSELDKKSEVGGGLYYYNTVEKKAHKILSGTFHQIIDINTNYIVLDEMEGALILDKNKFSVVGSFGHEAKSRSHGLCFCPIRKEIFIGKSGLDKISVYSLEDYAFKYDIVLSSKTAKLGYEQHHMNDICVRDGYLYVSLFSHSGSYQIGIYDGGIMEIDLDDIDTKKTLINEKWMPHSVTFINNELCFVDSMYSHLYRGDKKI